MLAVISVFILSLATFAQPKLSPQERAKMLTEKLSLTKDQSAQVEKIFTDAQDQMKTMSAGGKADRGEMRKVMESTNTKIENLLDDKQKDAFKKMQDERRKGMKSNSPDSKSNSKTDKKPDNKTE
jgi:Spy/CpxP family protein refolding chaperone